MNAGPAEIVQNPSQAQSQAHSQAPSRPPLTHPALAWAHPLVQEWFLNKFGSPTEPQIAGWPAILRAEPTLISAPTGSGKTLAAFLVCIDGLLRAALEGRLSPHTHVVYVSPLKALSNDVQKNLDAPLAEIQQLAGQRGYMCPEIRTGVRTGDTLAKDRAGMLRHPPHILVTTPESLYILLTAGKSRQTLTRVSTVIVDEIHAIADDKRGSHLALTLERLEALVCNHNTLTPLAADQHGETSRNLAYMALKSFAGPTTKAPQRIGLSATQNPIELVASFLTGSDPARPPATIIQVGQRRTLDLAVEVPSEELGSIASTAMWTEIYDKLATFANQHRSTLVFVNTRRLVEKLSFELTERLGPDAVAAHHGSLSRTLRLDAEQRLKAGEIKILIATASLELGIDIGNVDLVCQINTTRAVAVAMQRVGRAGHWRGAIPKGRFFATTRDDLLEQAALLRKMTAGELDRLEIPEAPLDVLMQQIVAAVGAEPWNEDALFATVRRAWPYRDLTRTVFDEVVDLLHNGIESTRGRYGAYLLRDRVHNELHPRRGARMIAISNGGAIPDTSLFAVMLQPENVQIATLDEHFAVDSSPGDVVLLGNTSWRIQRIDPQGKVLVEDAHGAPPSIPFWEGEAPQRTAALSDGVSELRAEIDRRTTNVRPTDLRYLSEPALPALNDVADVADLDRSAHTARHLDRSAAEWRDPRISPEAPTNSARPNEDAETASTYNVKRTTYNASPERQLHQTQTWLRQTCHLCPSAARQLIAYVVSGRAALGAVPTRQTIIAERFFDEGGGQQLILHAPFGGRLNKAWGLALRKRFCRGFNFELQAAATDNGINISLAEQHSFPLEDVFRFLTEFTARELLEQACIPSPLFKNRWRWAAGRSLQLLRMSKGKRVAPQIQRSRSDDLLASVFPHASACPETMTGDIEIPDHPLVREVMRDTLTEAMDIEGLEQVLRDIASGAIKVLAVDTPIPSVFAHELVNAMPYAFLDPEDAAARRTRAVNLRRALPDEVTAGAGRLDPEAIATVRDQLWPDIRDDHELHDLLLSLTALPLSYLGLEEGSTAPDAQGSRASSGMGFSPYVQAPGENRAFAPEGNVAHTFSRQSMGGSRGLQAPESEPCNDGALAPGSSLDEPNAPLEANASLGMGFSPYIQAPSTDRASAPEGSPSGPTFNTATSAPPSLAATKPRSLQHWPLFFTRLAQQGRAHQITLPTGPAWLATERLADAKLLWPEFELPATSIAPAREEGVLAGTEYRPAQPISPRDAATTALVQGWLQLLGPTTAAGLAALVGLHPRSLHQSLLAMEMQGLAMRGSFEAPRPADAEPFLMEWCERRILQRIHRLTMTTLRKQVEPVSAATFNRWLQDWHHVAPATEQNPKLEGEEGVLGAIEQLEGFEAPAVEWERTLLPARIENYDPRWLDNLCLAGVLAWGRISPHPAWSEVEAPQNISGAPSVTAPSSRVGSQDASAATNPLLGTPSLQARVSQAPERSGALSPEVWLPSTQARTRRVIPTSAAPITFWLRESATWLPSLLAAKCPDEPTLAQTLSPEAQHLRHLLQQKGAAFTADLQRDSNLTKLQVSTALWELAAAGLASADGFDQLRAMMDPRRKSAALAQTPAVSLRKRAAARTTAGRWSLLCETQSGPSSSVISTEGRRPEWRDPRISPAAPQTPQANTEKIAAARAHDSALDAHARILLCRYGVLFRELLTRESNAPKWRDLAPVLRRLEARGEIRGGRFVSGAFGEQFALPEAVEGLRTARRQAITRANEEEIVIAAADPLNLVGILVPGDRVSASPGKEVRFRNGALAEDSEDADAKPIPNRSKRTRSIVDMLRAGTTPTRPSTPQPAPGLFG